MLHCNRNKKTTLKENPFHLDSVDRSRFYMRRVCEHIYRYTASLSYCNILFLSLTKTRTIIKTTVCLFLALALSPSISQFHSFFFPTPCFLCLCPSHCLSPFLGILFSTFSRTHIHAQMHTPSPRTHTPMPVTTAEFSSCLLIYLYTSVHIQPHCNTR